MYAVFQIGSKQYRVVEGQIINTELIHSNNIIVEFDQVLLINNGNNIILGSPFITGSKIIAEIIHNVLSPKIKIVKFRRRKHSRKCQGHRQYITKIKIVNIKMNFD